MEYIHHYHSPLGGITVASDGEVLTGLWFDGQKYFAVTLAKEHEEKILPVFEETDRWLDIYFQGKEPDFLPPVSFASGSEFRQEVWKILLSIPYGKTMTYGEIAACIAKKRGLTRMSAQAVGGAVGHNPISIIVPCHRVVGTDGSLTGYRFAEAGTCVYGAVLCAEKGNGIIKADSVSGGKLKYDRQARSMCIILPK